MYALYLVVSAKVSLGYKKIFAVFEWMVLSGGMLPLSAPEHCACFAVYKQLAWVPKDTSRTKYIFFLTFLILFYIFTNHFSRLYFRKLTKSHVFYWFLMTTDGFWWAVCIVFDLSPPFTSKEAYCTVKRNCKYNM